MSDWIVENKDSGPAGFNFTEQPDKWGYLNNPRWVAGQSVPMNYTGMTSLEPQIWTPEDGRLPVEGNQHEPCGHWHKGREEIMIYLGTYFNVTPEISPPSYIYGLNPDALDIVKTIELADQIAVADLKINSITKMLYAITRSWAGWHTEVVATLYKIDLTTHQIVSSITTALHPTNRGLALDPQNGVGYFIDYATNCTVTKFNLDTLATIATKTIGVSSTSGSSCIIDTVNQKLFIANGTTIIRQLNLADFNTITSVTLTGGLSPSTNTLILDENYNLYAGTTDGRIFKITNMVVIGNVQAGDYYNWTMCMDKTNNKLYVISSYSLGLMSSISLGTFTTDTLTVYLRTFNSDIGYPHVSCAEIPRYDYLFWSANSIANWGIKSYVVKMDLNKNCIIFKLLPKACLATTIDWIK